MMLQPPRRLGDLPVRDGALPRTLWQSLVTPVITTSLYFVVFGAAIGSRMSEVDGVPYGAFIVPGLIMLSLFTESLSNASFGIYLPKFTGTIYELLSAPVSAFEIVLAYVGAAATKSILLGLIILATANAVRPDQHRASAVDDRVPRAHGDDLLPVRLHPRHLGRGLRAAAVHPDAGHHAAHVPGRRVLLDRHAAAGAGAPFSLFNPVVYLISGFRWSFYGTADVGVGVSLADDAGLLRRLPGGRGVDLPDRLPAEELTEPG